MLTTTVRPVVLRTARNALPRSFIRPLGVSARAYKQDDAKEHKESGVPEQKQVQKHEGSGMMRADPYMRFGRLTISGERKEERKEEPREQMPGVYERRYGKFVRSFSLPKNVNAEGITASCKDGVLSVVLPKAEEEVPRPKEIAIE